MSIHRDIHIVNVTESYKATWHKVRAIFHWGAHTCGAWYVLRANDDVYLRLEATVSGLYKAGPPSRVYAGLFVDPSTMHVLTQRLFPSISLTCSRVDGVFMRPRRPRRRRRGRQRGFATASVPRRCRVWIRSRNHHRVFPTTTGREQTRPGSSAARRTRPTPILHLRKATRIYYQGTWRGTSRR